MLLETKKILKISILAVIALYLMMHFVFMVSHYIAPYFLRISISLPLLYISAASGSEIFSRSAGKFSAIFGISIGMLLFLFLEKIRFWGVILKTLLVVGLIIVFLVVIFLLCVESAGNYLKGLFEQALRIVAPCIADERDRVELSSLWASMEEREHYKIICNKIYEYAQKNNDVKERYSRFIARHNYEIAILGGSK